MRRLSMGSESCWPRGHLSNMSASDVDTKVPGTRARVVVAPVRATYDLHLGHPVFPSSTRGCGGTELPQASVAQLSIRLPRSSLRLLHMRNTQEPPTGVERRFCLLPWLDPDLNSAIDQGARTTTRCGPRPFVYWLLGASTRRLGEICFHWPPLLVAATASALSSVFLAAARGDINHACSLRSSVPTRSP